MRTKAAIAIFCLAVLSLPAISQITIGLSEIPAGGIPVDDEGHKLSNALHFIAQLAATEEHIQRTIEHISWTVKHFNLYVHESTQWPSKFVRWGIDIVPGRASVYSDTYGKSGSWLGAINQGLSAVDAYTNYVERIQTMPTLATIPGLDRWQNRYSAIEMADGANARTLATIGDYRMTAQDRIAKLISLRGDSLSDGDPENTTKAVLQKTNGAVQALLQEQYAANQLNSALAEMTLEERTARRNELVRAYNDEVYRVSNQAAYMAAHASHVTEGFHSLVVP
jgi:hypothetical protein